MPRLKQVLSGATGQKRLRRLSGKIRECISPVSLSVSSENVASEKLGPDAANSIDILASTSVLQSKYLDPQ